MPFQLNPSKLPIWQTESTLKLGLADQSQLLDSVSTAQERLIHLLFQGVAEDHLDLVGESVGLEPDETRKLIDRLRPSLLEKPTVTGKTSSFNVRFAEIIRIGFENNQATEDVLASRANSLIMLPSLDRTGLMMTKTLAEVGFRRLVTGDYGMVTRTDLGELGYPAADLGITRLSAARNLLQNTSSQTSINHLPEKAKTKPDLVVVSGMHRINPSVYRSEVLPHVAIEYALDELRVSGVIRPGDTACLACRELWESENNASWTATSIQLSSRNDHLDDGIGLLMATSIATKTICESLNSKERSGQPGFRVNLKTRAVTELSWQPHPSCDCRSRSFEPNQ